MQNTGQTMSKAVYIKTTGEAREEKNAYINQVVKSVSIIIMCNYNRSMKNLFTNKVV